MNANVETKPVKKEEISEQMMPEIPYDPEGGKKPIQQMMPEIPPNEEWGKKPPKTA